MSSTNETRASKPAKAKKPDKANSSANPSANPSHTSKLPLRGPSSPPLQTLKRLVSKAVRLWAWLGGIILGGIAAMTTLSVLGRLLFAKPLLGDFEITELACAMAIFMFLPLAQWHLEHTTVDIFTRKTSPRFKFFCRKVAQSATLLVTLLLLWRMALGAQQLKQAQEVTMILGLPRYLAFPAILLSLVLLACVLLVQLAQKHEPEDDSSEFAA